MGTCCSKTDPKFSSPTPKSDSPIEKSPNPNSKIDNNPVEKSKIKEKPIKEDANLIVEPEKKEQNLIPGDSILVTEVSSDSGTKDKNLVNNGNAIIRTSSCTRDEVEAILIQCGRLSRSSSAVQTPVRKYSGSKRSFDFDQEGDNADMVSEGRRRTPGRERERRERRVSRSPGKRSESPNATSRNPNSGGVSRTGKRSESPSATCHNPIGGGGVSRPGKMVSVPPMATDGQSVTVVKKVIGNKKVVSNASPRRSRSPGNRVNNVRAGNENQNVVLSRSNSRKGELSPYRRNPLREIDQNSQKQGVENMKNSRTKTKEQSQADEKGKNSRTKTNELPQADENASKASNQITNNVAVNVVVASEPPHKPQALTRTRSSRLSRDLENLNLESQNMSPTTSYTALLLEDIQNFHNKTPVTDSLQQSLSKACSIVGEIADPNSNNGKKFESKEPPLVETEVVAMTDLIDPSFQKYVTVKRGNSGRRREEEEESSGSNSFGGPQHWISSSLWETNSNESTDCWASSSRSNARDESSSRSNTRDDDRKKRGNKSSPAITTVTI